MPDNTCPHCGSPPPLTVKATIWRNGRKVEMAFCSRSCADEYQMGCEG